LKSRTMMLRTMRSSLWAVAGLTLAALMLAHPADVLQSALKGVAVWWDVLFPALLPFLVISELLLGLGVVHMIGTLLDPLMKPLFGVPGSGGFVMAMGFASGYPVASKLTSRLREENLVNRVEGERLISFATTSDPIFLVGAVSVGFFHEPGLALILAAAHYGSAVLLGLVMRFYGRGGSFSLPAAALDGRQRRRQHTTHAPEGDTPSHSSDTSAKPLAPSPAPAVRRGIWGRALQAMHTARKNDGRPPGLLLQDAVVSSLQLIIVIGGLVVFFSVVMTMLEKAGVMRVLTDAAGYALQLAGISPALSGAAAVGLFEVTLGVQAAGSASASESLRMSAAVAALVLSWGGLSVHAQVLSLISRTGMRYAPFAAARALHGIMAAAAVYALWPYLAPVSEALGGRAAEAVFGAYGTPASAAFVLWGGAVFLATLAAAAGLYAVNRALAAVRRAARPRR